MTDSYVGLVLERNFSKRALLVLISQRKTRGNANPTDRTRRSSDESSYTMAKIVSRGVCLLRSYNLKILFSSGKRYSSYKEQKVGGGYLRAYRENVRFLYTLRHRAPIFFFFCFVCHTCVPLISCTTSYTRRYVTKIKKSFRFQIESDLG